MIVKRVEQSLELQSNNTTMIIKTRYGSSSTSRFFFSTQYSLSMESSCNEHRSIPCCSFMSEEKRNTTLPFLMSLQIENILISALIEEGI